MKWNDIYFILFNIFLLSRFLCDWTRHCERFLDVTFLSNMKTTRKMNSKKMKRGPERKINSFLGGNIKNIRYRYIYILLLILHIIVFHIHSTFLISNEILSKSVHATLWIIKSKRWETGKRSVEFKYFYNWDEMKRSFAFCELQIHGSMRYALQAKSVSVSNTEKQAKKMFFNFLTFSICWFTSSFQTQE